jgi:hypothetical protein
MRDFDADELHNPLPGHLIDKLEWEEQMDKMKMEKYSY